MNVLEYVKGVKTFKVTEIQETLLTLQVASSDMEANLVRIASSDLNFSKEMNQWVVSKAITKSVMASGARVEDLLDVVNAGNRTVQSLVPILAKVVKDYNEQLWDGKLITLKQANILNLIEHLTFWMKYSRAALDTVVSMYLHDQTAEKYLSGHDLRWINGTMDFYREFTLELLKGSSAIKVRLDLIPDVDVSESAIDVLEATQGTTHTALLNKGFGIHLVTPVFWVEMLMMKINLRRIEEMRRDNERFAMKINQAVNKQNGAEDPQLERRIEIYQNEIIKNSDVIAEIEKKYA